MNEGSITASLRARLDAVHDLADRMSGNEAAPLIREALNGYVHTRDLPAASTQGAGSDTATHDGASFDADPNTKRDTLTDAERDGYGWEQDGHWVTSQSGVDAIVAARVVEALNQAADAVEKECASAVGPCFCGSAKWLRDRALAEGAGS